MAKWKTISVSALILTAKQRSGPASLMIYCGPRQDRYELLRRIASESDFTVPLKDRQDPNRPVFKLLYLHVRIELCVLPMVKSPECCSAGILGLFLHHLYLGPEGLSGFQNYSVGGHGEAGVILSISTGDLAIVILDKASTDW